MENLSANSRQSAQWILPALAIAKLILTQVNELSEAKTLEALQLPGLVNRINPSRTLDLSFAL